MSVLKAVASGSSSGGGVSSLQGETGAVTLTSSGGTVTITTPTANTVNLESAAGGGTVTTTGSPASGNLTKFSGATSITNADLTGDVTTNGTMLTTLATVNSNVGSFTNATFTVNGKGLVTAAANGTTAVTSVSGTSNRITSTGGLTPVIDISATYVGQTSITTLGTVATGVWQGNIIQSPYGGTGNGFTKFSGPAASEKTFILPNASSTFLTTNAAVTSAQGGTGLQTLTANAVVLGNGTGNVGFATIGTSGRLLIDQGAAANPSFNAMSADATIISSGALTLATVNSNVGAFTNATLTVNGKGLVTAVASGTTAVTSVSGTSNRITSTGGITPVIDISASYVGQTSITTLGTVASGVWQGTKIGLPYGGTNADLSGTGGTSQVLKQTTAGAAITVAQLAASDLSNGTTGSGTVVLSGTPTLTTAVLGSSTATTQTPADNSTKVATTAYVDNAVLGQNFKEAVKYASTSALPSIVYANGSSGVGATLTGVALAAISLDSSSPSVNDRVLIKNQVSTFQNGLYAVTATGSGIAVFVLTRVTDFDQSTDIKSGDSVFVTAGSTLSTTTWAVSSADSPVMGTDPIIFAQTAGQGSFTAGNGISITGVSIAIDTSVTVDKTTVQTLTNKTLTSPTLTTPVLGIPSSGTLTNCTGLPVVGGGTGLSSGTSGGVPYYSNGTTMASSAALAVNSVVVGGGAGSTPATTPVTISATGQIALYLATINAQSGTTYTLAASDTGKIVEVSNASAITVTLPNNLSVGFYTTVSQTGAGQITFSASAGATLRSFDSYTKTAGQYAAVNFYVTTNTTGTAATYIIQGRGA